VISKWGSRLLPFLISLFINTIQTDLRTQNAQQKQEAEFIV